MSHMLLLSCVLHCVQFADDIICTYKVSLFLKEIVYFRLIQNCKFVMMSELGTFMWIKNVYTIKVLKDGKYSEKVWLLYVMCL